jgi:HEPN domain-containing protein
MNAAPDANLREAQRWLQQAGEHFAAAEWAAQGRHWPNACFQFQQAAELALKALLIRQGEQVRVHGLLHLLELLRSYYPEVGRLDRAARSLDRFYIPARYPDALPTGTAAAYFNEQDSVEAQTAADEVLSLARQTLAHP